MLIDALVARLAHPVYAPLRPWLERLPRHEWPSHAVLNALAEEAGVRTESGRAVRFVPPGASDPDYELHVHQSGCVSTRPQNGHDLFNALAWLAFPRTKARINALHAAEIPREAGRRGRVRDLLTIFDEGGAVVLCADRELEAMIRGFRWKTLFRDCRARVLRDLRFVVLGHAVLEKALEPWPGVACKVIFAPLEASPDEHAAHWLAAHAPGGSPKLLPPVPVFGYPGWLPESASESFYDDARYFRPPPGSA